MNTSALPTRTNGQMGLNWLASFEGSRSEPSRAILLDQVSMAQDAYWIFGGTLKGAKTRCRDIHHMTAAANLADILDAQTKLSPTHKLPVGQETCMRRLCLPLTLRAHMFTSALAKRHKGGVWFLKIGESCFGCAPSTKIDRPYRPNSKTLAAQTQDEKSFRKTRRAFACLVASDAWDSIGGVGFT